MNWTIEGIKAEVEYRRVANTARGTGAGSARGRRTRLWRSRTRGGRVTD
ncbi:MULTISPECIES: hypothetical protein [Actinokineospora]|nr:MULTISPECIES: hypothetical protein [Actinokineospora]UVS80855.1 hypothetical protein Actkin_04607 [Actinokineospora sp. UTMC 2448]